jgi:hypothetical protein
VVRIVFSFKALIVASVDANFSAVGVGERFWLFHNIEILYKWTHPNP